MKMTSFRINGRAVQRLSINGREVNFGQEPVACDALCFTAEEAGSTVKINANGSAPAVNLQTSTDGGSWTPYTVGDTITLSNVDDKVYFKAIGSNSVMGSSDSDYNWFEMTGSIAASGNVNSLLEEDEETARTLSLTEKRYCYYRMFYYCSSLTQAPALPSTTLADRCYQEMFSNCNYLTKAPELPATALANSCYYRMFYGCSSLAQAPELPSTTLADECYYGMFHGCSSLTQAPELPATALASYCYGSMFYECRSLTQTPELPATTLVYRCYASMFSYCSSLTQVPELPATTLAEYCYLYMFESCPNLNYVKVTFTNWTPTTATESWLNGVANSGTFECPQELINNTTERTGSTVPSTWNMVAV